MTRYKHECLGCGLHLFTVEEGAPEATCTVCGGTRWGRLVPFLNEEQLAAFNARAKELAEQTGCKFVSFNECMKAAFPKDGLEK